MKMKQWLKWIPRPVKAIFYTILVLVLAIAYYLALGCPAFSMKQEFRRAEKAHMIGPSKIVDTLTRSAYDEFDKLLVGETEHGICFFGRYYNQHPLRDSFVGKRYCLSYIEKTGDLTICSPPNTQGYDWAENGFNVSLPVYLFTEYSHAVRAEIELTVDGAVSLNDVGKFTVPFRVKAQRSNGGFFRFALEADTEASLSAIYYLSQASGGDVVASNVVDQRLRKITATVWLYDATDQLIIEKTFTLVDNQSESTT